MKNVLPAVGEARQPRGAIKVNGQAVTGWLQFSFEENEFYQPDTFSCTFAMSALPAGFGADWWSQQSDLEVELFAGFPQDGARYSAEDLETVFFGVADDVTLDWDELVISVTGRDLTAKLIDHKTSEKYINLTASDVAQKLASKNGLDTQITATKEKVGTYYKDDHVALKDDRTEWDLLTYLARQEGFQVFVRGKTLHFQPKPTDEQDFYLIQYQKGDGGGPAKANSVSLKSMRTLTVSKDIRVTVTSWSTKTKKAIKKISTRKKGGASGGEIQKYSYNIPNLTPDQAQARADQIRDELSRHEMRMTLEGPADNLLHITDIVRLAGTGTAFDQDYFPQSISRTMSLDSGYDWSVDLKNHSPESEPTL